MGNLLRKKASAFYILNCGAWIAYGLVSFAGALPYIGLVPHLNSIRSAAFNRLAFALIGLLSTSFLRSFFQRKQFGSLLQTAAWVLPLSCLMGLATTAGANWARQAASGQHVEGWASLFGGAVSSFAIYICWCASYFSVQTYSQMQAERQNALEAKANAHEAQLKVLRGQLNPHFLFNSLNSIQALITENPSRAQHALGQLASLLRHSLRQSAAGLVPLHEEMAIILDYLAMEKIRFEENLVVHVEIEPGTADWHVPRLLLHPLVDNAVRYGMQTSSMPLCLGIRASASNGTLRLEVANTGHWLNQDREMCLREGNGLGLRLLREQLEQNYGDRCRSTRSSENGWVTQRIEISGIARYKQNALSCVAGR
jgi:two-component system, LytTR family, sensor kinase